MKCALFPGQGSQYVGMAKDLYEAEAAVRQLFDRAEEVLGFSFCRVVFEGPEDELVQTSRAQPAIFVHSLALWSLWGDDRPAFAFAAGHSLGEFSALTAAGALDFETGLRLVMARSAAMQKACDSNPGTMAALTQLPPDRLRPLLEAARASGIVEAANFNADGQIVISGERAAVEKAVELAPGFGARRATLLKVGGAFHSPLMAAARDELAAALHQADIRAPQMPVVLNVTAQPTSDPAVIRTQLAAQLVSPVRWLETMQFLGTSGVSECVEVGPGKVLQGLLKRTLPDVARLGLETASDLAALRAGITTATDA